MSQAQLEFTWPEAGEAKVDDLSTLPPSYRSKCPAMVRGQFVAGRWSDIYAYLAGEVGNEVFERAATESVDTCSH